MQRPGISLSNGRRRWLAQWLGFAAASCLVVGGTHAADASADAGSGATAANPWLYRLTGVPRVDSLAYPSALRFQTSAGIGSRAELSLSAEPVWRLNNDGRNADPFQALSSTGSLEAARATYRYTWYAGTAWQWKLGVSTNLDDPVRNSAVGFGDPGHGAQRVRFGSYPLMHLAGAGRIAEGIHWQIDADGLRTRRGNFVDLGMRLDYSLSRSLVVYGGYRWTEPTGEAEDVYQPTNRTNVGLRYRFY